LAALSAVAASQRAALVLCYLDGFSVPEVAAALGKSTAAVHSLLERGRASFNEGVSGGCSMSTVDRVASILAALDRPVRPRPEFAESLWADLLAELQAPVHARPRRRLRLDWFLPQAPPRLRLLLITALLLLILAGIATATYIGVRAVASPVAGDNGPVTLIGDAGISTIGPDGRLHTVVRCRPTDWCGVLQSVAWSPDGRWLAYAVNTFAANSPIAGLPCARHDDREREAPRGRRAGLPCSVRPGRRRERTLTEAFRRWVASSDDLSLRGWVKISPRRATESPEAGSFRLNSLFV
jgi:Sigma-70, region 4